MTLSVRNPDLMEIHLDSFKSVRRRHLLVGLLFLMILVATVFVLTSFDPDVLGIALLALLLGIAVAVTIQNLVYSLSMNRFGVFPQAFAPPVKPLSHRGRYIVPLDNVETGFLIHQKGHGMLFAVRLATSENIVFTTKRLLSFDWDWEDVEEALNDLAQKLGDRVHRFRPWQLQDKKSCERNKEREISIDLAFAIAIIGLGFAWMIAEGTITGTEPWSRDHRALVTIAWASVGLIFIALLSSRRWLMWRKLLREAHEVTDIS